MDVRWEYRLVPAPVGRHGPTEIEEILNGHGAEGWELVDVDYRFVTGDSRDGSFVFKRRIVACVGCDAVYSDADDPAYVNVCHTEACKLSPRRSERRQKMIR